MTKWIGYKPSLRLWSFFIFSFAAFTATGAVIAGLIIRPRPLAPADTALNIIYSVVGAAFIFASYLGHLSVANGTDGWAWTSLRPPRIQKVSIPKVHYPKLLSFQLYRSDVQITYLFLIGTILLRLTPGGVWFQFGSIWAQALSLWIPTIAALVILFMGSVLSFAQAGNGRWWWHDYRRADWWAFIIEWVSFLILIVAAALGIAFVGTASLTRLGGYFFAVGIFGFAVATYLLYFCELNR